VISTALSILAVVVPVIIACVLVLVTAYIIWRWYRHTRRLNAA